MRTLKLTLSYDGTAYSGWQRQANAPSVQAALEDALERITGESIRTTASGRTDAGVHAIGQVVSFDTSSELPAAVIQRALNAELPRDMAVLAAEDTTSGFHAIRAAKRKRYRYLLRDGQMADVFARPYSWQLWTPLDVEAMHRAAQAWLGEHDFASFQTSGAPRTSTVRTVLDIGVRRGGSSWRSADDRELIVFEVEANGFLYNMARAMVGTLVEIGKGARPVAWAAEVLAACDRRAAGMTAPPQGLFLVRVDY